MLQIGEHDGKIRFIPAESYVKYFNNFIKNLEICAKFKGNHYMAISLFVNFVRTKCDHSLQKISISGDFDLLKLSNEIGNFLRNVEVVKFSSRTKGGIDEALFLKHSCPNVTTIKLEYFRHVKNVNEILQQKYPRVTHFYFMHCDVMTLNEKKLKTFFQTNANIKCVAWRFRFYISENLATVHATERIKIILDYALNLQHLLLCIETTLKLWK